MIRIICNSEAYTYNVYHIIKAFYPSEKISSRVDEEASNYVTAWFPGTIEITVAPGDLSISLESPDVRERKYQIDRCLYEALREITGRALSWGILTGVRPTKIAMSKIGGGMDRADFVRWFMEDSLVSQEKAELAYDVALREKELLGRLDYTDGYSLYVGIPFCPTVCTYCSFSSGALRDYKGRVEDYLEALMREIAYVGRVSRQRKLNTIYIGGGTPTTLTASQLDRLLCCIEQHFVMDDLLEYTVEAGRPDSITREKLKVLRRHQVTRISINPQSMQQRTLNLIGRGHTVEQVADTFVMAREEGFDNINMDIIAGLPGETLKDMEDTLARIERLGPDSLTVHSLAIKRAAKMGQRDSALQYETALKSCESGFARTMSGMIGCASDAAKRMGLMPYYLYRQKNIAGNFENVGYAKVDKAGIYNILIMEEKQSIAAVGAGASTKIVLRTPVRVTGRKRAKETNLIRVENVKAIDAYIDRIDEMIERKGEWLWR